MRRTPSPLRGFSVTTTPLPAPTGQSGAPEAASGFPESPPSAAHTSAPRGAGSALKGASRLIARECDRLLCGDMRRIFLGGRNDLFSVSRSMNPIGSKMFSGAMTGFSFSNDGDGKHNVQQQQHNEEEELLDPYGMDEDNDHLHRVTDAVPELPSREKELQWLEVHDNIGGNTFRGFVAEKKLARGKVEKSMFLFFEHVAGMNLKEGMMAVMELADECFEADRLVVCLERNSEGLDDLGKGLAWIGFEPVTLAHWVDTFPTSPTSPSVRRPSIGSFSSMGSSNMSSSFSSSYSSTFSTAFPEEEVTSAKWLFMGCEL